MVEKSLFGEGKNIEFKRKIPQKHERFLKDIIAFSNCTGGKVIVGIEDATNVVCGIGNENPFKLSDDISNMISDACIPQINPDITVQTLEDRTILVIDVAPGRFRPYYLKSVGRENSTYIRINGTSRVADARTLQELELEGQHVYYDSLQEIGMEYDEDLAKNLCRSMKEVALSACETEEEKAEIHDMTIEKMEDMGLLRMLGRDYVPTHAFNLMTVNRMKHAKIQCALFKGNSRDTFIDRKEFRGPIYGQIEEAYQFVLRHINLSAQIDGIVRRDVYELPVRAVREAIINAVTHRSYLDDSCIQVSVYDDRVEVLSPGGLYGGLDIEAALSGKSKCRNAAISEAFHYMKIIEAWGTGLGRIQNSCREYGLKEPVIEEFGDGFRVIFYRKVINADQKVISEPEKVISTDQNVVSKPEKVISASTKVVSEPEKVISDLEVYRTMMRKAGVTETFILNIEVVYRHAGQNVFKQSDVMEYLECSKTKATNVMNAMKKAGIIEKVTGMGFGRYRFV